MTQRSREKRKAEKQKNKEAGKQKSKINAQNGKKTVIPPK